MTNRNLPIRVELGAETLVSLQCLTDALLALAAAYQRGEPAQVPKAARTGTMSPLPSTGEGSAPVVPVQPPSPAGPVPPAEAAPVGISGQSDVSSLETTPPERLNEPTPAAAFSGRTRTYNAERLAILRRDWPAGRPRAEIVAELNALPGPPIDPKRLSVWCANNGLVRVQKPPRSRNDVPSVAEAELTAHLREAMVASVPLSDVLAWGVHQKIKRTEGETERMLLDRIQDARRKHDLPPFRVLTSRCANPDPLPAPHIGGGPSDDYSKPSA